MDEIRWKQFVKVYDTEQEGSPYYIQWMAWCWRKPIWKGLVPLLLLVVPIMCVDIIYAIVAGMIIWSQH